MHRYFIYNCVAVRSDKTTIIRDIKIPSTFYVSDLAVALVTVGDDPGCITSVVVEYDGITEIYDKEEKEIPTYTFDDLEEHKVIVTVNYDKGPCIKYVCECVGYDVVEKRITRKTPILLSALGCSRYTHDEYLKNRQEDPFYSKLKYDGYYATEDMRCRFAMNDMRRLFTLTQEDFYPYEYSYY